MDERLGRAQERLSEGDAEYFSRTMARREHWRLFDAFGQDGEAVCLDIETNGFMPDAGGYVTVVGLYDGKDYLALIKGNGLSAERLSGELKKYKYLITFFGSVFDVPFLERTMPGVDFRMPHFDLCFGAKKIGLGGGLKKVEEKLGIQRPGGVKGMDGYDAVLMWEASRRGREGALERLVDYNREDTVNLMGLAKTVYSGLREKTGISDFL